MKKIKILTELFEKIGIKKYKILTFYINNREEIVVRNYSPLYYYYAKETHLKHSVNCVSFRKW